MSAVRNYVLVTIAYWAFTLTDGALRMLVLLHFHALGYTPVELAFLFLFYELFGIVTNLFGGWLAARAGLRVTLLGGLAMQVVALGMLGLVGPAWSKVASVAYVMGAQSLSGIAKDLTKMSAKSSIKLLVPENQESSLFRWVAVLTGSKNALKGAGFFLGGMLLAVLGFRSALFAMASALVVVLLGSAVSLPRELGKSKAKAKFKGLLSKKRDVNVLSAARFFLFGARDIWFVVGRPRLSVGDARLGVHRRWGSFLALWVVGYGVIQSVAPAFIGRWTGGRAPQGRAAQVLAFLLAARHGPHRRRALRGTLTGARGPRRARGVRRGLRHQLVGALVPHPRVLRRGQGRDERRLLLHGQRGRPPRGYPALGHRVPACGRGRVPLGVARRSAAPPARARCCCHARTRGCEWRR